jgi:ribosomal protein L12E/L44/L45/RPP1/RPP2
MADTIDFETPLEKARKAIDDMEAQLEILRIEYRLLKLETAIQRSGHKLDVAAKKGAEDGVDYLKKKLAEAKAEAEAKEEEEEEEEEEEDSDLRKNRLYFLHPETGLWRPCGAGDDS